MLTILRLGLLGLRMSLVFSVFGGSPVRLVDFLSSGD